ncbi:MAG: hypothetical protein K0R12_1194 [Gammaproteobacteria bacterium]|jgi:hypothetical protein|nr:hypothetical protein [Gammaproteobacteria bacterium]
MLVMHFEPLCPKCPRMTRLTKFAAAVLRPTHARLRSRISLPQMTGRRG